MCYDKQTMILTNRGYKTFEEIGQGDNIATFNKKGRFVGWNNNWTVVRRSTDEYSPIKYRGKPLKYSVLPHTFQNFDLYVL